MNSIIEQALGTSKYLTSFGKQWSDTTVQERTDAFLKFWDEWANNSVTFPNIKHARWKVDLPAILAPGRGVKTFAKKHNLWEFHDYQIRGDEVRFKCEDHALLFRLQL